MKYWYYKCKCCQTTHYSHLSDMYLFGFVKSFYRQDLVTQAFNSLYRNGVSEQSVQSKLTVKEVVQDKYIKLELALPFKIKQNDISGVLSSMRCSLIQNVSIESIENGVVFLFSIHKDNFMKNLFTYTLLGPCYKKDYPNNLIIEFSSPNIAKPFHFGHLRSTIIGNFIANLKDLTDNVIRLNYLGDWGTQIGFVKVGLDKLKINQIEGDPIKKLYEAYVYANKDESMLCEAKRAFTSLEQGDKEATGQWEKIRSFTIDHLRAIYEKFGVRFDEYAFESMYSARNIEPVFNLLEREGLLEQANGTLGVTVETFKPLTKSDGSSLYLGRDVAAALDRVKKHACDNILYVVDKSQSDHLNALQYIVSQILKKNIVLHVPFGRVIGMSTRRGTGIFLSDILDKAIDEMAFQQAKSPNTRTNDPDTTRILAVSSLIIYLLQHKRMRDFKFDWGEALRSAGDTGVKLQYTHSRLVSLEKKCGVDLPSEISPSCLNESVAIQLTIELFRFDEVLAKSQEYMESYPLVIYSFKLCNLISQALKILPIKGQSKDLGQQRLMLFHCSRKVLNNSMKILGIYPLQQM